LRATKLAKFHLATTLSRYPGSAHALI